MDPIAALLDGPRARGAFLLRSSLDPPWALRIEDEAPLTLMAGVRGGAWVVPDAGAPARLGPGDVAIARGPGHYTVADDPATPPGVVIGPGQTCGTDAAAAMELGLRTWGTGSTDVLVTGTYLLEGDVSRRVLRALPPLLALEAGAWNEPLVGLLAAEVVREDRGQEAVLDRLLDLLLVAALRAWFDRPEADPPGWYRAAADPVVGPALELLHERPAHPWTVAELAARVGSSRAALARRFAELVGEPPMAYLTGWRIALAADLLLEPGANVGSVAAQVGYSTPFALSAAFKRVRGISPREHRELVLGATPAAAR